MGKSITIKFEEKSYVLEYNRLVVGLLEKKGINVEMVINQPVNTIPSLFAGAFYANHKSTKPETINKIFDSLPEKADLTTLLCTMYMETADSLFNEPEEGTSGNATWELN